jgi:hypothetical protein
MTPLRYDRFYPTFLEPLRDTTGLKMLEIGLNLGFSYRMWLQYFPLAMVYFLERDQGHKYPLARYLHILNPLSLY